MDKKTNVVLESYQLNVKDEAEKILLKHYWEQRGGYPGREHFYNALIEIDIKIDEIKLHLKHFKNNIYLLDRLIFLKEVKMKIEKL